DNQDGGAAPPTPRARKGTRMPPKRAQYVAVADLEKDSFDSDETGGPAASPFHGPKVPKMRPPSTPPPPPAAENRPDPTYINLADVNALAATQETVSRDQGDFVNLATQHTTMSSRN
ncbi:hypothetical protein PFISCL1PPCAC_7655, partial [Pristionchus fissidentatus]